MKKILILETNAFNGHKRGGSYIQGAYYEKKLGQLGYKVELFVGIRKGSIFRRLLLVLRKIKDADYIMGFGTPLLAFYLQWLSLIFNKKGIFCVDSIITSVQIIKDYLKKKIYPWGMIFENFNTLLSYKVIDVIFPPRNNLIVIASSKYIRDKLKNTKIHIGEKNYLYPKIVLSKRSKTNQQFKSVLFYGTLFRGRGVFDLVHACRILWEKNYHFKLIILGWPVIPMTKKYILQEINRQDRKNFILKEFVKKPENFIKRAAVVVLPFRYPCAFQTPYTLLEPMAWGVPVITTDVGSHHEWVKDGETGIFCKIGNIKDIADKIEKVLIDSQLAEKIAKGAYSLLKMRNGEKDVILQTLIKLENK